MTRKKFKKEMICYVNNPEMIPDEIIDKYCSMEGFNEDSFFQEVQTIEGTIQLWEFIQRQSDLLLLLKSINVIQ